MPPIFTQVRDTESFIELMMATRVKELPPGNWIYELKFDGYRALAFKTDKEVRLVSRNRTNFSDDYPLITDSLKQLPAESATLDGEIVALDQHGRPSFQLLQGYGKSKQTPIIYYAFDLLFLEGTDLRSRPLIERRKLLEKLLKKAPENIRFSEELQGSKEELIGVAKKFQLEAQIKFTEWTSDDQLRQPVFLGLRTDKAVKDVVRE